MKLEAVIGKTIRAIRKHRELTCKALAESVPMSRTPQRHRAWSPLALAEYALGHCQSARDRTSRSSLFNSSQPEGKQMTETEAIRENYNLGVLAGEAREQQRIIKLLKDVKADLRKKLSEVSGDSQSETYWYNRIQQLDNYIALIKGEK